MCQLQAPFLLPRFTREMEGGGRDDLQIDAIRLRIIESGQIQHEDGQWCSAPLLFRQDLPNSYWRLLASFGKFI